jgi:hypothetical protein
MPGRRGVFLGLTILQARSLPARPAQHSEPNRPPGLAGVRADWRHVIGNRAFVPFALAMIGSYILSSQIYLALPLQDWQVLGDAGGNAGSSTLFAVSAIVAVYPGRPMLWMGMTSMLTIRTWSPNVGALMTLPLPT